MSEADLKGPKFVQYFDGVLYALQELGGSGRPTEIVDFITSREEIDESEYELLSNGTPRINKNINWARFYLAKAGFIDGSKRGVWSLTEKGRKTSLTHADALAIFQQVHQQYKEKQEPQDVIPLTDSVEETEILEFTDHREAVMQHLLTMHPSGFERLCQRLLRESEFDQVEVTGRSGDQGIDGRGILKISPFVSFRIAFQCKRYSGTVGPEKIRDFRGSIMGRADKGILLTTSSFTSEARKEATRDGALHIELVDGEKIINMLEELELGLTLKEVKKIYDVDEDFFKEFDG